jgi:hypothetical protein
MTLAISVSVMPCLERAPLASAKGNGLNMVADSATAPSNKSPKRIDFLHALSRNEKLSMPLQR